MRYCFVGLAKGAMAVYPAGLARAIVQRDGDAHFTFIYSEKRALDGIEFPADSRFVEWGSPRASSVRKLIRDAHPSILITTAQRIPDSAFVSAAREAGIPSVMFQHGLYLPFMRREPGFFLQKLTKTIRYMRYAIAIADIHRSSRLKYVSEFAGVYIRGNPYRDADIGHSALNVDRVLLNGEYWREFHSRQYHYPSHVQEVAGYPDYDQLVNIEDAPVFDGTCYVAQTLVEDGRLSPALFRQFLFTLREAVGADKLIVKLHPKSIVDLYDPLRGQGNISFTSNPLPRARRYVGHYSTYLALVPFLSPHLYLWEFEGHDIPECLAGAASAVGSSADSLRSFLTCQDVLEPDRDRLARFQFFFWRNPEGSAYDLAADRIIAMACGGIQTPQQGAARNHVAFADPN